MQATLDRPPSASLFFALFCMLFSVIFNYTLSIMAGPYIVGDLGGSNEIATYTVSFYAIGNALGVPLGRQLIARIGSARLIVCAMCLFAFFSLTCAIAPNYPFFNASRFMQGFVSGPFYALVSHLIASFQPKEKKGLFNSITLTIFTSVPVLGACWGGVIAYLWNWRWVFYLNVPLLLILGLYLHYRLKGFNDKEAPRHPFDGIGYLSYFIGIFCLSFAIITGQELDWLRSPLIIVLGTIGILSLLFFIFWDLNHPDPIVHFKLLKNPIFAFALFNLAVLFSAYFGMIILLSLWLKLWANYTPNWIAALLGVMAVTALFSVFISGKRFSAIDNRIFLVIAIVLLTLSCYYTLNFDVDIDLKRIVYSRFLSGVGLAFFLAPIFKLCFLNSPVEEAIPVLGMFQVTRALSSGLGASVYDTIWQRRQVFFHDRLGSELTVISPKTQEFFTNAEGFGLKGEHAVAQLEFYLQREATSLALDDCFYLMAWILVGLLLTFAFTFFAKRSSFATEESSVSR